MLQVPENCNEKTQNIPLEKLHFKSILTLTQRPRLVSIRESFVKKQI